MDASLRIQVRSADDLCLADTNFDGLLPLIEIEEMRSGASEVGNTAVGVYYIQALGCGAVSFAYGVVHLSTRTGKVMCRSRLQV